MRAVISCFDDFQVVLKKSFDNMSPGGWLGKLRCFQALASMLEPPFQIHFSFSAVWNVD
jgi:hypothetical protein